MNTGRNLKTLLIILFVCPFILVSSCTLISDIKNFEKPEKLSVKTSGTKVSVPLGSATAFMSDHFNVLDMEELIRKNSSDNNLNNKKTNVEVYDFNDKNDQTVQKYILDYPVHEIPLDVTAYMEQFDGLDFAKESGNSFSQKIKVDAPQTKFSEDIDIDIGNVIQKSVECRIQNIVIPEFGSNATAIALPPVTVSFTKPGFNTITFKTGSLIFKFKERDDSEPRSDVQVFMSATIKTPSGTVIAGAAEDSVPIYDNRTVRNLVIPMDGKTLTNQIVIEIKTRTIGGEIGKSIRLDSELSFSDDTEISHVTGLTVNDTLLEPYTFNLDETVSLDELKTKLKQAKITDGNLYFNLQLPAGWSGIKAFPEVSVSGDLNIKTEEFKNVSADSSYIVYKTADLFDKVFAPDSGLKFTGKVPFKIQNATLDLTNGKKLKFNAEAVIKKVHNAQVYAGELMDQAKLTKDISIPLDAEAQRYIKSITFNKIGFEGTIETDLASNDMILSTDLTSAYFEMSKSDTVHFSESAPYKIAMVQTYSDPGLNKAPVGTIDLQVDMSLAGSNKTDPTLVSFSAFELGKEYTFDVDVKLVYDWKEVVLKTDEQALTGNFDSGFSFKTLLSDGLKGEDGINDLVENTKFKAGAVEGMIFVTRPNLNGLEQFKGFKGSLKTDFGAGEKCIFPKDGSTEGPLSFSDDDSNSGKTFKELANSRHEITDISKVHPSGELNPEVLTEMFNSKSTINLSYNLQLAGTNGGEISICREDVETLKENGSTTTIKISLGIIISLRFETVNDVVLQDAFGTFGETIKDDLLGRDSASEECDYKKYADLVKNIYMEYLFSNNSGWTARCYLVAENESGTKYLGWDEENSRYTKEIKLKSGVMTSWNKDRTTVGLSRSEINSLFSNYPFCPKVRVEIPGGQNIEVPRNASFSAKAVLTAETDGEYVIWDKNKD